MAKYAIIRIGGKQYLVHENEELYVEKIAGEANDKIELEALGTFDGDKMDLGMPVLKATIPAQVVEHVKGDKIHIRKFKSKVRYRSHTGFRPQLTKIKILSI